MKIKNKKIGALVFALLLSLSLHSMVRAEEVVVVEEETLTVNLVVRDGDNIIFDDEVELQDAGNFDLSDSGGSPHPLNNRSVLALVHDADLLDDSWSISDLQYFNSFGSFYLRCIESDFGTDCDNWQYAVGGSTPSFGMDQKILDGGENVYVYFGQPHRVVLSSSTIVEETPLTVRAEKYDFEDNSWVPRSGVTVGVTQFNPSDMFNPIEVATNTVNASGEAIFTNLLIGSYDVGVKEDFYFPTESLTVKKASTGTNTGGSSGGGKSKNKTTGEVLGSETENKFDVNKAFEFLKSKQEENGSFGEDIYTDWATIALVTGNNQANILKLIKYLGSSDTTDYRLTDFERHAMALMVLGLNPYNTNGVNYISEIVSEFDGKQFGDVNEDNDDIFALLVLQNAGYDEKDTIIANDIKFILGRQKENGSWDESIDMTGAAIASLATFEDTSEEVKTALESARTFLRKSQKNDGGFGNVSATAWAMEGILALGETTENWTQEKNTPFNYFGSFQETDGGIKNENVKNRIWETSYAIKAFSPKTWNELMYDFEKEDGAGKVLGSTVEVKKETVPSPTPVVKKEVKKAPVKPVEKMEEKPAINETAAGNTENEIREVKENGWFSKLINFIF